MKRNFGLSTRKIGETTVNFCDPTATLPGQIERIYNPDLTYKVLFGLFAAQAVVGLAALVAIIRLHG